MMCLHRAHFVRGRKIGDGSKWNRIFKLSYDPRLKIGGFFILSAGTDITASHST